MSAIALPFLNSANAALVRPATPVNVEFLASIEPVNLSDLPVNDPQDRFVIQFTFQSVDHAPRVIEWDYGTDDTERDNDLAALIAAVATTI